MIENEIDFLRNVADEIQKIKCKIANKTDEDRKTWDELYYIKQQLLETRIAELKKELKDLGLRGKNGI
jgi:hypothetical protein